MGGRRKDEIDTDSNDDNDEDFVVQVMYSCPDSSLSGERGYVGVPVVPNEEKEDEVVLLEDDETVDPEVIVVEEHPEDSGDSSVHVDNDNEEDESEGEAEMAGRHKYPTRNRRKKEIFTYHDIGGNPVIERLGDI